MAGLEGDDGGAVFDHIVTQFSSYEDYLDSQITTQDLYYLENEEMARQLVELGFRGSGEVLKREEFIARKSAAEASRFSERQKQNVIPLKMPATAAGETSGTTLPRPRPYNPEDPLQPMFSGRESLRQYKVKINGDEQRTLSSAGKELKDNFLKALAEREEANRNGKMSSIIFIRDRNARGHEVSAYIDYAHRLKVDDFDVYFGGKRKLFPRRSDLSFYNWDRNLCCLNSSPNYQVIAENPCGLLFKNKSDRKVINVDPKVFPGDNTTRTPIETGHYLQVVIYDHVLRRKL